MLKKYISTNGSGLTMLVKTSDRVITADFRGCNKSYATDNEEAQAIIEASEFFKNKRIALVPEAEANDKKGGKEKSVKAYEEVVDAQGAIEVLNNDYKVAKTKLKTPEDIQKQAAALGISFPNLID